MFKSTAVCTRLVMFTSTAVCTRTVTLMSTAVSFLQPANNFDMYCGLVFAPGQWPWCLLQCRFCNRSMILTCTAVLFFHPDSDLDVYCSVVFCTRTFIFDEATLCRKIFRPFVSSMTAVCRTVLPPIDLSATFCKHDVVQVFINDDIFWTFLPRRFIQLAAHQRTQSIDRIQNILLLLGLAEWPAWYPSTLSSKWSTNLRCKKEWFGS